jgi:hypothetical protein
MEGESEWVFSGREEGDCLLWMVTVTYESTDIAGKAFHFEKLTELYIWNGRDFVLQ